MPYLIPPEQALCLNDLLSEIDQTDQNLRLDCPKISIEHSLSRKVLGLGTLEKAAAGELSFLTNPRYTKQLSDSQASWIVMHPSTAMRALELEDRESYPGMWVLCEHPYLLYAKIAQWFYEKKQGILNPTEKRIHSSAIIDPSAVIEDNVTIGPLAVIEANVHIQQGSIIEAGCFIGHGTKIGTYCHLFPRVTIYHGVVLGNKVQIHSGTVIGADGFGYAPDKRTGTLVWQKIPQFGTVRIGNYVEIGANTTVDRGALEDTVIEDHAILDNQIQIAHNVQVGQSTAIAGCAAIAGSSSVGKNCIIGGGAEISGHLTIADNVHISGGTPVIGSIDKPGMYTGVFPTTEHREWEKNAVILRRLSQLRQKIVDLESTVRSSSH